MPGIGDPRFDHAVIVMCLHTADAAMGLIINKLRPELKLGDVLEHLGVEAPDPISSKLVLDGGPVKPDRGYVLHSSDYDAGQATQNVAPGLSLTATRDVLEAMATGKGAPSRYLLALGYAGWGAGQLESELLANAWQVVDLEREIVFDEDLEQKWNRAIRAIGIEPAMLSSFAGRA
jgi:putative transcriptional regulator